MAIRLMTKEDCEAFLALDPIIFPNEEPWTEHTFNYYFKPGLAFVSYDENGQMNGYVFAKPRGKSVYISNLGVHPEAAGRGIGSQLMDQVIKAAQADGSNPFISLQVRINNDRAKRLYQKFGFIITNDPADEGFHAMKRPLHLAPVKQQTTPDVLAVEKEIKRLRKNALSFFSMGNNRKADAIEAALNTAILNKDMDVRQNDAVKRALAKHRLCSFFRTKTADALLNVNNSYPMHSS
ncbi:Acetyltransferase YpeA [Legionella rubrilucens]|uniref:Acetyltransferase YpeA n=1 Tax=Legionella rubrilucens TaxID=458 RepID=A0A0W0XLQ4_9GAMM|nr:N-acetyltransferase [Legionella rubrilucens]KTD45562.1 Acetyltransferase YpeA [Legionella rubrilucens]